MSLSCIHEFEQRLDFIGQRFPVHPRKEVLLTRMQFMIYKKFNELVNHNLQPYGVNDTVWTALMMLYSSQQQFIYPSDLSHIIVSSRTNITRLADEMVGKGWVSRQGCESDRRKIILTLTPAGIALVEDVMPRQWVLYEAMWQGFDATEKKQFESLQRRLIENLADLHEELSPLSATAMLAADPEP